jgi:hypothetical protein
MKILLSYFSRTGNTERLAREIGATLQARGHELEWETITPAVHYSWTREVARDFPRYPSILLSLASPRWRQHHAETYCQVEEDIRPLRFPDVSGFDLLCIGGPKWAQISYPVARYLQTVRGIRGKRVGSFATFGGPPLKVFELELLEKPMARLVGRMGAQVVANLGVSSGFHEASVMPLFRIASRHKFDRPIEDFMLGSEYANRGIKRFCDELLAEGSAAARPNSALPSAASSVNRKALRVAGEEENGHAQVQ